MSDPRLSARDEAGFTLVEIVVAFAILSLVMTVAVQIIGAGNLRARVAQDRTAALAFAQSHLAVLAMSRATLPSRSSGSLGAGFGWTLDVSPLAGGQSGLALMPHSAVLSVTSPPSTGVRVTLRTVLLRQPAGPPE